ncbi:short-chain dehydrogenase-like protein [Aspergillus costaricaensis CBS 115574]|uniref:Short-chain dehydrogenase-like protein n=1 Tax=Aspergillus costaricaensis CBS 115574 TaxID=1448317 RepID=A0ACD1IGJ2_9EURO|nr:short-chain dehydrogenase-like protein [Aspergillus costaricaensis CBS 115574]RAK89142.1 short-chain dehydrogenase-like protein [Aspergillus costaricaensis CBS 115574]
MASYLITGASRGIGLATARTLASKPASEVSVIFAAARTQTDDLKRLVAQSPGRVLHVSMDVEIKNSIQPAVATVESVLLGKGLDVLINNAGIMPSTRGGIENMDNLDSVFHTNVTSAHLVTSAFLPLLRKGNLKKVVNISTTLGSITMAPRFALFPVPAYKVSKAALNMLTMQYAQSLADQGFTFLAISPGWVKTDLGGERADITAEQSVQGLLDIIVPATQENNGKFFNIRVPGWEQAEGLNQYDGEVVPW